MNSLKNWADTKTIPQIIDAVTYDQYESDNPLRIKFSEKENIHNEKLRQTVDFAQDVGAEIVSAYINPFYLTHKVINIPTNYQNVVDTYKKHSQ